MPAQHSNAKCLPFAKNSIENSTKSDSKQEHILDNLYRKARIFLASKGLVSEIDKVYVIE